jgi:hypothetical protein
MIKEKPADVARDPMVQRKHFSYQNEYGMILSGCYPNDLTVFARDRARSEWKLAINGTRDKHIATGRSLLH